jgi:hypothetical protein
MRKHALKLTSLIAMALAVTLLGPPRAAADDDDPPSRVARLSLADGSVSFQPAGTQDWVGAVVNRPLTTGDKLWADRDSRAELQIGSGSIRLGANTGFSFLNLDDNTTQLQLTEGTVRIRLRRLSRREIFEVDTPNLAFTALRPGIYRINVNEAGDTTVVVVRDGDAEVTGGGQSYSVHADETGIFSGTDQLNADIEGVGSDDELERWSYERDRREDHSASRRYVSEDAIGYEDLDQYGGWRDTPDYGTVWFPHTTVVGWAPYRYGHWVWIAPWGYTWVDDEPWGFAPFHYGRWIAVGGAWGWVPCRPAAVDVVYVRPVYAPALVAWVGGPHVAIGVVVGGGESVGWFPLGPREVYVPSYRVSRTYVNNVNITNTTVNTTVVNNYYNTVVVNKTTVNNVTYVNQRVPGAVTATSTQVLSTSQPVARNVMRVDERQMASAQVNVRAPAVAPERQAFVGSGRPAQARPPEQVATRAVVAKTAPPPPPAPIERQQALIRQNGGQPPAASQVRSAEAQQARPAAVVRMAPSSRPATPQQRDAGNAPPQNVNQNVNRPMQQQQSNVQPNNRPGAPPANTERPNNAQPNHPQNAQSPNVTPSNDRPNNPHTDRPPSARPATEQPNTAAPNAQPNRPTNNDRPNAAPPVPNGQPNRPANDRPNTASPNAQPNRPTNNDRPNAAPPAPNVQPNNRPTSNDRPPSARPVNPPPNGNPQLEQQHRQQLDDLHRQQDQERQRVEQQQAQERQRADQQRADEQRRQQMQEQQQRQLQDMRQKHDQEQQRVQQRQEQEHQQQRPPQAERQQAPPPRQQQQAPPPRQQQQERQQPPPRQQQQDKPKDKPPIKG